MAEYDRIGQTYPSHRRADPRIAGRILHALGSGRHVLNVGAGTGSYEPSSGRHVVAAEPSATMRSQRAPDAAPCVGAVAAALPFADRSFDVAMTILSLHHWPDQRAGLDELARVAPRQVVFTFDPEIHARFWMVRDYLPESAGLAGSHPMTPEEIADHLGGEVHAVEIPSDCRDGFYWAYWKRPEAYLDAAVRAGISGIAQLPAGLVAERMELLAADLASGAWHERNAELAGLAAVDGGYRLVTAGPRESWTAWDDS